jgi:putative serine protease PepD
VRRTGLLAGLILVLLAIGGGGCTSNDAQLRVLVNNQATQIAELQATIERPATITATATRSATRTPLPVRALTPTATVSPNPTPSPTAALTPTRAPSPSPTPSPTATREKSIAEVVQQVGPSVVEVRTDGGVGTGFVAFATGDVLTASHVVGSADAHPTVVTTDGAEYPAIVSGFDEGLDVALLAVPNLKAPPLPFAESVSVGDSVLAIGYAAGLSGEASVTRGIVSAKRVSSDVGATHIQTDAPLNPGNSGGPLLNEHGEVVGLNVYKLVDSGRAYEGLGFAVSADDVARLINDFRGRGADPTATPTVTPTALPTATPTVMPTATSLPTAIAFDQGEWCGFRASLLNFEAANDAWVNGWNDRVRQGPLTRDEVRGWATDFSTVSSKASGLPKSAITRGIAGKAEAYAEQTARYLASFEQTPDEQLRLDANQSLKDALETYSALERQLGSPRCQ